MLDLPSGLQVLITIHPSALLRLRDEKEKRTAFDSFVQDLRSIGRIVRRPAVTAIAAKSR